MELTASQLIKLYMQSQIIVGNIYYAPTPEARLLDALNGLADRGPVKRGRFIELNDVTIQHEDGKIEKLKTSYINKATVQMAITLGDANAGRGLGGQEGPKSYPFIEKSPILVHIETPDYVVIGNIYRIGHQKVWSILEETMTFLPLTQAVVYAINNGAREMVPFVAVNKDHIQSLQEENDKTGSPSNGKSSKTKS